ncbi:helix-turn-helix transcriptional regulator [Mycobacterium sp. URHD0025]|uniref:helix-turn-helix domain-containing protein n=1 Tax=Mycobacterium sp. URHD0025 TaxID=1298864 RepID=UPI000402A34C|nr:helix-turn-helix transcriptional regulator [Mycobacterium sp. URHD0025]
MTEAEKCLPLAVVVGRNCQRIRKSLGLSQDELATYARDAGLKWSTSRVSDFEAGRTSPTFATVLLVSLALQRAAQATSDATEEGSDGNEVQLADLVGTDGCVQLSEDLSLPAKHLSLALSGSGWILDTWYDEYQEAMLAREFRRLIPADRISAFSGNFQHLSASVLRRSGLAEDRIAKKLGISRDGLADISSVLWQRTFSEERDRRAGDGANQQRKGHIARELQTELERALADGRD